MTSRWALPVAMSLTVGGLLSSCDPQRSQWGLDAIRGMATPADPQFTCGVVFPADETAAERAACHFGRGARPSASLPLPADVPHEVPIRHVIVMMKENRSFDHLLGRLHERGQSEAEGILNTFTNPDLQGVAVPMSAASTTCIPVDPAHQFDAMTAGVHGGAMDGFVASAARSTGTDGHFAMSVYDEADLPFTSFLANMFALSDRHFAPVQSGTFANRNFMLFGHNAGAVDTGIVYPAPNTPSLLHLLMNAGWTWGVYSDDLPLEGSLGWSQREAGVHRIQELYDALDQGTLPNVVFVDGVASVTDDHPTADLQRGEAWSRMLYEHARSSPQWERLAIVFTYDEAGGFADHVPPPEACAAVSGSPFVVRGPRVPLVMISPWARRHFVSHVATDHTAITRFIAALFDLPALSARDANSSALLELFDFSCGRDLSVPVAPEAGTGGCPAP